MFGGEPRSKAQSAAENAVAQDKVNLLCLRFAEPIAQVDLPIERRPAAVALLGIL
jgi:hypothetical protein